MESSLSMHKDVSFEGKLKKDIEDIQEYNKYFIPSATYGTENLRGASYIGKVISNIGNIFFKTVLRMTRLVRAGEWINNQKEIKKINSTVIDLSKYLDKKNGLIDKVTEKDPAAPENKKL